MPIAMKALERSTGKTAKELLKMMELGQLGQEYLVPFMNAMGEIANEGNAVAKAMETARTQEKRFINQSKQAANTIFKSGFEQGLTNLYKTLTDILENAGPQLEKIGKVFGIAFDTIAATFKYLEPVMKIAINNMEILFGAWMLRRVSLMGAAMKAAFLPITVAVMAAQELLALFSDDIVGTIEASIGEQYNFMTGKWSGIEKQEDGSYRATEARTVADEGYMLPPKDKQKLRFSLLPPSDPTDPRMKSFTPATPQPKSSQTVNQYVTIQAPNEEVANTILNRMKTEALGR